MCCCADETRSDSKTIPYPDGSILEGAAGANRSFDVDNSPYFPVIDFYNKKSEGSLTILEKFKTIQQTTEFSCGPACVLMVLEHFGKYKGQKDRDLYELRENKKRKESMLKDMIHMFECNGEWDIFSTYDLDDPSDISKEMILDSLKDNKPIIFGDNEWGGHWRIIIGYDDMGDNFEENDVLIIAEPYDTTNHHQDGYITVPFERLFYNWNNYFDPDFNKNLFLIASPKV